MLLSSYRCQLFRIPILQQLCLPYLLSRNTILGLLVFLFMAESEKHNPLMIQRKQWGILEVCSGKLDIFLPTCYVLSARAVGGEAGESARQISAFCPKQKTNVINTLSHTLQSLSFFHSLSHDSLYCRNRYTFLVFLDCSHLVFLRCLKVECEHLVFVCLDC